MPKTRQGIKDSKYPGVDFKGCSATNVYQEPMTAAKRIWIARSIVFGRETRQRAAVRLGMSKAYVQKQVDKYNKGSSFQDNKGGQYFCADEVRLRFIEWVIQMDSEGNSPDPDDARDMLIKMNGENDHTKYAVGLSKKRFKGMCHEMQLVHRIYCHKDKNKKASQADIRNYVAAMAAAKALLKDANPQDIMNSDASNFTFNRETRTLALVPADRDQIIQVQGDDDGKGLNTFVKYHAFGAACGTLADAIYIMHDSNPSEGTCNWEWVAGLGPGFGVNVGGWYVVMHPKAKAQFARDFYRLRVPEFVASMRRNMDVPMGSPAAQCPRSFLLLDGEYDQLNELIRNDFELTEWLEDEHNVIVIKLPSATSGTLQPMDCCTLFKHAKGKLSLWSQFSKQLLATKKPLFDRLMKLWKNLDGYPDPPAGKKKRTPPVGQIKKMVEAVIAVNSSISYTENHLTVANGFRNTGWCPVDARKMMGRCRPNVGKDDIDNILDNVDFFVDKMLTQGMLKECDMTGKGVKNDAYIKKHGVDSNNMAKDEHVPHQQRLLVLSPTFAATIKEVKADKARAIVEAKAREVEEKAKQAKLEQAKKDKEKKKDDTIKDLRADILAQKGVIKDVKAKIVVLQVEIKDLRAKNAMVEADRRASGTGTNASSSSSKRKRAVVVLEKVSESDKSCIQCSKGIKLPIGSQCNTCKKVFCCQRTLCREALEQHFLSC